MPPHPQALPAPAVLLLLVLPLLLLLPLETPHVKLSQSAAELAGLLVFQRLLLRMEVASGRASRPAAIGWKLGGSVS